MELWRNCSTSYLEKHVNNKTINKNSQMENCIKIVQINQNEDYCLYMLVKSNCSKTK